jgi:sigma-E factor negative regulatory protein RseC
MKERSSVLKILDRGFAEVKMEPNSACAKCGACISKEGFGLIARAWNEANAKAGDAVMIEIAPSKVILASFFVFISPIIAMVAGYFIGKLLAPNSEVFGIFGAIISLSLSFLALAVYDKRAKSPEIVITEVLR